jgi:PBSX family phage terminase large subunit
MLTVATATKTATQHKLIPYAPLNKKQTDYIIRSQIAWLNVLEGGKRASKNITNLIAWTVSLETHPDKIHLAAGYTQGTAKMNIIDSNGFGLKWIFAGRCREGLYQNIDALYIQTQTGEKIVLVAGGGKVNDVARIKGFSLGSVYITEVNECAQPFVQECFDRTAASNRRQIFLDLNPKPPRHWFYLDVLDFHAEQQALNRRYGYNSEHLTVADNMSLTDEQLRQLLATYDRDSQWFKRDILGQRTTADGRIYEGYKYSEIAVDKGWIKKQFFIDFSVGVDVGGTDATVATLNGFTQQYDSVVAIDGYYHKQGIDSGKDHAAYAADIAQFIKPWTEVYPRLASSTVFAESADKLFRQALRKALDDAGLRGMQIVPSYKKDGILDRINTMRILINQGRKKIADHMEPWFQAYEMAVWDSGKYLEKEWVRVDDGSYPVDCLDSDEYGIQPFKPRLIKGGI